ncbi:MAG: AAA family ATPase, partial [Promethearchaeota archaeon]
DPALLRPGRFDRLVYVPSPDAQGRQKILEVHTAGMPITAEVKTDLKKFARDTEGYSGADLENVAREAGMQAIREQLEDFKEIGRSHFEFALKKIQASLTPDILAKYEEISEQLSKQKIRAASGRDPGFFS